MQRSVSLIRYAKLSQGWRRGAAVLQTNGKIKHPYMLFGGAEVQAPEGRYQLVRYEQRKPVYTDLGNDPSDALNRYRVEEAKQAARVRAVAAGLIIAEPEKEPATKKRKPLKQWVEAFLDYHRDFPHRSDDSIRVYTAITSSFMGVCKAEYPDEVTKEEIVRWHKLLREKYSDRTCSDRYMSLRGFLRYCGVDLEELIPRNLHLSLRKYTEKTPNTYKPEQVSALIEASTDEDRALLWDFAYKTGLRDSELRMVTRFDLHDLDGGGDGPMLHVKERDEYGQIKDAEEREIELHPSLVPKLARWLERNPNKILLFGTAKDRPDTKMLLALKVTARRAGLNCGRCKGCLGPNNECREFTLHRFRRTYTTRLLRATQGDLRSVMSRTGHSDIQSVMRYLAPAASVRQAVAVGF